MIEKEKQTAEKGSRRLKREADDWKGKQMINAEKKEEICSYDFKVL
jgi:hypothetical protein